MRALSVSLAVAAALICTSCDMFQTKPPELAVDAYAKAQQRMGAGDYSGAAALLTEFVSQRPTDRYASDAWLLLGDCRMQLKDWPGAQSAYEEAGMTPRTTAIGARAQAGAGQALAAQGRSREAVFAWEAALRTGEADIDAPRVLLPLGRTYLVAGNWLMGRDRLARLVRNYPSSPQAAEARDILSQPDGLYSVEMGTFVSRDEATGFVEGIAKKGVKDSRIVERPGTDRPFAVRAGSFVSRDAAQREADRLKAIVPDAVVFP